ncbi:MAG: HD-GYP domain-containing protein [Anaerolineales bacterium]|nr:HD-GYP domain-containing protein [Anaerolineales bacterium]
MQELHPNIETTPLFLHLKECMDERRSVEFEDESSYSNSPFTKWKIKMDPVPEGVFIHSTGLAAHKTKIKVRQKTVPSTMANHHSQYHSEDSLAHNKIITSQSKSLAIEGWLDALDSRTKETNEHILRVTEATVILAKMAGISENEIIHIRRGALLHDIGKTGIPDPILLKSGKLTADEWEVIRKHPVYAYDLVYPIEYLRNCLSIPYSHHEKWDGTGYPQGLRGEDIPLPARLFAVVDVWETLSFDRVYRKAWPHEKIMDYIQQQSGCHFDPKVVSLFFHTTKDLLKLVPQ